MTDHAVTLTAVLGDGRRTIRVYDGAHTVDEMHRYTRDGGKQPAVVFHDGTPAEGPRVAQLEVRRRWAEIIEGWRR